jgi:hypothetical protein
MRMDFEGSGRGLIKGDLVGIAGIPAEIPSTGLGGYL